MTASRLAAPDHPLKTWAERCWRIGSRGRRWYYAAALILLVIAAALRFYELPAEPLWYDEAVAAHNVAGSFAEALANTRERNTSPILYPLFLYAIQKVDSSALSLRILPAVASLLTVAALLFLLPPLRFPPSGGLPRRPAFHRIRRRRTTRPGCPRILPRRPPGNPTDCRLARPFARQQKSLAFAQRRPVSSPPPSNTAWRCSALPSC